MGSPIQSCFFQQQRPINTCTGDDDIKHDILHVRMGVVEVDEQLVEGVVDHGATVALGGGGLRR